MSGMWLSQIAGVMRLELKKTAFSKRGWWIYCLAAAPVLISLMHFLLSQAGQAQKGGHSVGLDGIIFAGLFLFFCLRGSIFFGCMGLFSNLFRGEMLEKTLHYYYMTPVRRELIVFGKYLAGLAVSLMLFLPCLTVAYLLLGWHFGPAWKDYLLHGPGLSQLGSYLLVASLACAGYGAVFLACGLFFKNPMIAAAVVWVWEGLNPFLPSLLKKISVIFYLKSLCPLEVPAPPPFSIMAIETDPAPLWVAVPGLLAISLILVLYAAVSARQGEINYGE
jgi:ABC-type transport system involved in multi-copper enzyme maturation permease subunit